MVLLAIIHWNGSTILQRNCIRLLPAVRLTPEASKPAVRAGRGKEIAVCGWSLSRRPVDLRQRFTIADAYLFTVLRWAYGVKLNMDEGLTHIESYMQRVAKEPTTLRQRALKQEGLRLLYMLPDGSLRAIRPLFSSNNYSRVALK